MKVHFRTNMDYLFLSSTTPVPCKCSEMSPCKCGGRYEVEMPPRPYRHSNGFLTYRISPYSMVDDYPPYHELPSATISDYCQFNVRQVASNKQGKLNSYNDSGLPCVSISLTGKKRNFLLAYSAYDCKKPIHLINNSFSSVTKTESTDVKTQFCLEPVEMSTVLQTALRAADNGSISLIRNYDESHTFLGKGDLKNIYRIKSYSQPNLVVTLDNREKYLYMREAADCFLGWQLFFMTAIGHDTEHLSVNAVLEGGNGVV